MTIHKGSTANGQPRNVPLELDEESYGTQKFFSLLGPLYFALSDGATLFADELDTRLHPLLTQWIIKQFHDPKTNPHNAQLIFATHSTELLNRRLFRRDQIWLTHRQNGATQLYSVWDLRIRNTEDLRLNYLMGRYGGVPFIDDSES
jgi:AAA15 family ATPase/GTPase